MAGEVITIRELHLASICQPRTCLRQCFPELYLILNLAFDFCQIKLFFLSFQRARLFLILSFPTHLSVKSLIQGSRTPFDLKPAIKSSSKCSVCHSELGLRCRYVIRSAFFSGRFIWKPVIVQTQPGHKRQRTCFVHIWAWLQPRTCISEKQKKNTANWPQFTWPGH